MFNAMGLRPHGFNGRSNIGYWPGLDLIAVIFKFISSKAKAKSGHLMLLKIMYKEPIRQAGT
jgi:hypothetical protein